MIQMDDYTMSYRLKIEDIFAVVALIIGLILIFIIPPMCSPDENSHYVNAYSLATGRFFPVLDSNGNMGRFLPESIQNFVGLYNNKFLGHLDVKYNFTETYNNFLASEEFTTNPFFTYWNAYVNLVAYIPSGIAMWIYIFLCKLVHGFSLNNMNLLITGRLGNLLFYIFIVYYSIKQTPFKRTIMLIALLPQSIYLASTLSYDTIVIAFSMLLVSRLLELLTNHRQIKTEDIIIFSLCIFFLACVKQVYAAFALCLFAIPLRQFNNKKQYLISIFTVGFTGFVPEIIYKICYQIFVGPENWSYHSVMHEQSKFLIQHLMQFWITIWKTISENLEFYFISFIGNLGQLDYLLPSIVYIVLFLILVIVAVIESSKLELTWIIKILCLFALLASIYLIFAGTYIIWTSHQQGIGYELVDGVTGRYFIPLAPWLCILIANKGLSHNHHFDRLANYASSIFLAMSSTATVFSTLMRYWM